MNRSKSSTNIAPKPKGSKRRTPKDARNKKQGKNSDSVSLLSQLSQLKAELAQKDKLLAKQEKVIAKKTKLIQKNKALNKKSKERRKVDKELEAMVPKLQAECDTLRTINESNDKVIKLTMESQKEQIKYFQSLVPGSATSYLWLPQQKAVYAAMAHDEQDRDDQKCTEPHERNRNSKPFPELNAQQPQQQR